MTPQVKSRVRVQDHGEVFTNEREVNAMLDMVKQETHRIDSRFLEPACGNGSFLAEVLSRKLAVVRSRYRRSLFEYEKCAFIAIGSIYGVGILADNTQERRDGLYGIVEGDYLPVCKMCIRDSFSRSRRRRSCARSTAGAFLKGCSSGFAWCSGSHRSSPSRPAR